MLVKVFTDADNIFKILQCMALHSYYLFMLILRFNLLSML